MSGELTPTRPYLIRALHEWMSDNCQTPLIMVDASIAGVSVPVEFIEDDHIVLNVSWSATRNLVLDNEQITFEARFAGTPRAVAVPVAAVRGIYARESGQGMMFQDEPGARAAGAAAAESQPESPPAAHEGEPGPAPDKPGRPGLRIVK